MASNCSSLHTWGKKLDVANAIALDLHHNIYVVGNTKSADFPLKNANQKRIADSPSGSGDVFITKIASGGSKFIYSTFLGGDAADFGLSVAVDKNGFVYVGGVTDSFDFPFTVTGIPSFQDISYWLRSLLWAPNSFTAYRRRVLPAL